MKKQEIHFSFDDREIKKQGIAETLKENIRKFAPPFQAFVLRPERDFEEVKVTNPETGETRIVRIPKI